MKKNIGLLVAVELDSVFARYGSPGKTERRGGFDVYQYENDSYILHVIHSGIGELAASAAAELLIDRYQVELIVNFGVVGGLTEEMTLTQTCVVTRVVHCDFDLSGIDQVSPAQYPGYSDPYLPADAELVKKAMAVCPELKPVTCASADKFVGGPEAKKALHERWGADICEMESAGILLCCHRCGVPCLMIKAVSDGLTGGGKEYYEALQESASLCLSVTDTIIRRLG
ncbi:MAG: 5'-methylthioadenosine/S-adenosylhomocysteine nucleosidase [Oscillospiraceae bacterium]|nr:5'-methylthioadenosine/S-adenosylhomocysteine nucleosidase [Oscillospiraceae bacterium]